MYETLPPPLLVWKESPISSIYWPQTSAEPDQRSPQLTRGKNDVCPSCTRTLHPSPNIALHWPEEPSMLLIILLQPKEVEGLCACVHRNFAPFPNIALRWPAEPSMPLILLLQTKEVEDLQVSVFQVFLFSSLQRSTFTAQPVSSILLNWAPHTTTLHCPTLPWFILQFPKMPYVALRCPMVP